MNILCITVGKKHEHMYAEAIADFEHRILNYARFDWLYIEPTDTATESSAILSKINSDDFVIVLDERGKPYTSEQFAGLLEKAENQSKKRIVFIIGGAHGINETVREAGILLSLSNLVFPHQLVRLVLVEQIYRACTIRKGEKYHHA